MSAERKKMVILVSKGELDWAYPPFILASTGAASDMDVTMFFTFYGLPLLKKDLSPRITPFANAAMPMKLPFGPTWLQKIDWPMPYSVMTLLPWFQRLATWMMKRTFRQKNVATIAELRQACIDLDVKMIGCQMTMDVFGFERDEFIEGVEVAGAASFLEYASNADVQFFI